MCGGERNKALLVYDSGFRDLHNYGANKLPTGAIGELDDGDANQIVMRIHPAFGAESAAVLKVPGEWSSRVPSGMVDNFEREAAARAAQPARRDFRITSQYLDHGVDGLAGFTAASWIRFHRAASGKEWSRSGAVE